MTMGARSAEIERRTALALAAIREALAHDDEDAGVALYVSHHLEELEGEYWAERLGTATPEPARVLDLLELRSHWGAEGDADEDEEDDDEYEDEEEDEDGDGDDEDGIRVFDFTLPGEVTDYVLSVRFDSQGDVDGISMES